MKLSFSKVVLVATVAFIGGFLLECRIAADPGMQCTKNNVGCAGVGCYNYMGGYSCAELTNVEYKSCEPGVGTCPVVQKTCANVNYYIGGLCNQFNLCAGRDIGVQNTGTLTQQGCNP